MKASTKSAVALWMATLLIGNVAAIVPAEVATAQEDMATKCASELKLTAPSAEEEGKAPQLLVHGRGTDGEIWAQGNPSMEDTLRPIDNAVLVDPFDYESESTKWVAGSDAAHRLAETIVCYYLLYGEKVVVVAHSMGGLLTYEALDWAAYGVYVRDAMGYIATIGSPFEGSWLATATFETVTAFCKLVGFIPAAIQSADIDSLCREANSDWSTSGLSYDSNQLEVLPDLPEGITHKAIAGRIQIEVCFFACAQFSIGDGIVPSESATARYTDTGVGDGATIFDCTISEGMWCAHSSMLQAEPVQQEVKSSIEAYIASTQSEFTDLHGLNLPLGESWQLTEGTHLRRENSGEGYYSVVKTPDCNLNLQSYDDNCPGFTVIDTAAYSEATGKTYPVLTGECAWPSLRDGQWHSQPQVVGELIIGGKIAAHRTRLQCDVDERNSPVLPSSAEAAEDTMHSWQVGDIVIVDNYDGNDPFPGLEDLLARSNW